VRSLLPVEAMLHPESGTVTLSDPLTLSPSTSSSASPSTPTFGLVEMLARLDYARIILAPVAEWQRACGTECA